MPYCGCSLGPLGRWESRAGRGLPVPPVGREELPGPEGRGLPIPPAGRDEPPAPEGRGLPVPPAGRGRSEEGPNEGRDLGRGFGRLLGGGVMGELNS